jgi:hypothetical protein
MRRPVLRTPLCERLGIKEVRPAHVVPDEMVREAVDVVTARSRTRVTFAMA